MTGDEHYAEAERLLELAGVDSDMRQTRIRLAQVHATLATVDPVGIARTSEVSFYSDRPNCTCPALVANPLARTSTDPDCPIHGQGKD